VKAFECLCRWITRGATACPWRPAHPQQPLLQRAWGTVTTTERRSSAMSVWQISAQGKLAARLHEGRLATHGEPEDPSVGKHWAKEIDCLDLVAIAGGRWRPQGEGMQGLLERYFDRSERAFSGRSATRLSAGSCGAVRVIVGIDVKAPSGEETHSGSSPAIVPWNENGLKLCPFSVSAGHSSIPTGRRRRHPRRPDCARYGSPRCEWAFSIRASHNPRCQ
jgi:hypothetical protein